MPVARRSLRITEGYRRDLRTLVYRVKVDARKSWRLLDWNNLDRSFLPIHLGLINNVRAAQTQAVRLTAGYLGAYMSSELGEHVPPPSLPSQLYVGKSFTDQNLDEALRSPLIKVKVANKEGQPDPMGTGLKAMLATVDLNVKTAARQSLQDAMVADDRITGWRRAVRGTCDACMGAADGSTLPPGTPLDIHPNCDCVSEAIVQPTFRDWKNVSLPSRNPTGQDIEGFGLTVEDAVGEYQGNWYRLVNDALRNPEAELTPRAEALIKSIDQGMAEASAGANPLKLWRGLRGSIEDIVGSDNIVGKAIDEAAFSSTTAQRAMAEGFGKGDLLDLTVDKSVKALRLAPEAGREGVEILLERQLRYVITGVRQEGGRRVIEVKVTAP